VLRHWVVTKDKSVALSDIGVYLFNGNKIITTSGGGASFPTKALKDRAIFCHTVQR
jgi:dTDP-4-amino-4,6-dideoxygalactose transaminase